jgi:hypothetical protein
MTRPLPPALESAVDEPVVRPFSVLLIDLPDPVYVFSGLDQLVFDDADGVTRTWIGAGEIGAIDTVGESTDGSATGIRVTLFGVPSQFQMLDGTWVGDYLDQQAVRGVKFDYGIGVFNETFSSVDAVAWLHRYRLDQYKITDAGATLTVEVTGESRSIDQRRPAIKRFTDEYQQRMHPGDRFFEYVPQMVEVSILWDRGEQSAAPVGGNTAGGSAGNWRNKLDPI